MSDNAKAIEKIMEDNNLHGEIVQDWDNVVAVEIYWGDWKHEHLRFKLLVLEQLDNVKSYSQVTTEDNGTDCYSAVHRFHF